MPRRGQAVTVQGIAAGENTTPANRAGQLTPEQQRRLAKAVHSQNMTGLLGAGGFAFLFGLIVWAGWQAGSSDMSLRDYLLFGGLFVVSLLGMVLYFLRRGWQLAEVQQGRLERATGHVQWKSGRYRAVVPGRTLDLTAFNLSAGAYDFSYLPRSGRVVAAELAAADPPALARDELRHALAVTNHFSPDDLPVFRQGRQGPGTFRRLRHTWSTAGWLLLATLALLAIFVYLVNADVSKDLAPFTFLVAILLFLGVLGTSLDAIGRTMDVVGGQVASAAGAVHKVAHHTSGHGASTYYYYSLGDQSWLVSPEAARALIEGRRYRVYYLPRSNALVGIEPIE
jgi:hypothetical protein